MRKYVIITPAHNEEQHLRRAIESVRAQTLRPVRWVIVDDASTDATKAIAQAAGRELDFIRVISTDRGLGRAFSHKARAFNTGVEHSKDIAYDLIGNLDADVSFKPDYFANLVKAFEQDDQLGITGGIIYTMISGRFVTQDETPDSVAGAVQLFRRACFEEVGGGYLPLPHGGIDAAAEIIAKSKGWKVAKSRADRVDEHRQTGTATASPIRACYRLGQRFHSLGYDPVFFAARCLYRLLDEPVLLGSSAQFCGYVAQALRGGTVQLPHAVVQHLRRTQRRKLARLRPPTAAPVASNS